MRLRNRQPRHAPVRAIAITGCDGAGKSTLAASLVNQLSSRYPTRFIYLGQSSGRIAEWIATLPLFGAAFSRYLRAGAERVHQHPASPPGNIAALIVYLLSCWRGWKFRRMLAQCKKGYLLVTDRYPQAEVAGFRFDGPQLAKSAGGNRWVRALRRSEEQLYRWMASYPPTLLIRLDIDEQNAQARRPDHAIAALHEKIAVIPGLTFNGATIVDLDSREAAGQILAKSLRAVDAALSSTPQTIRQPYAE